MAFKLCGGLGKLVTSFKGLSQIETDGSLL